MNRNRGFPGGGRARGPQHGGRGRSGQSGRNAHQHRHNNPQQQPSPQDMTPQLAVYLQKWHPLVDQELAAEQALVKERLSSWPLQRLIREGLVLLGLTAAKRGSFFGTPVWVMRPATRGLQLPFHRFVAGDEVMVSRGNPLQGKPWTGVVLERGARELRLVSDDRLPTDGSTLRLDKGVNTVVYERMRAALDSLAKPAAKDAADAAAAAATQHQQHEHQHSWGSHQQPQQRRGGKRHRQQEEQAVGPPGTSLASLLVSPSPAAIAAAAAGPSAVMPQAAMDWARQVCQQQQQHADLAAEHPELGLNMSQVSAIANCCLHKLSLVHGPPGTGKTTTTVALLAQLVRRFQLPFPLLAVAQSHVAVDNLLEGLVDAGVPAVRVGQPVKVRDALRGATLDALLERHPRAQQLEQQEQQLRELRSRLHTLSGRDRGLGHRDCSILGAQLATARDEVMKDVLAGARVICATCAAAGSDILAGVAFPVVVLDEASQAAEPEALIPLTRGASHAVLVGDHMQLPPVCNSPEAAAAGLSVSLFERLMAAGVPSAMLQVQYRMHPCLSAFPNQAFYGGRLIDGVSAAARPAPAAFPWPRLDLPVLFVDVVEGQEEVATGGSKLNRAEAQVVKQVLLHLLHESKESRRSLGVITPYVAQLNLLNQELADLIRPPRSDQSIASTAATWSSLQPGQQQQQQQQMLGTIFSGTLDSSTAGGVGPPPPPAASAAGPAGSDAVLPEEFYAFSADSDAMGDVLELKTVDGYQGREKEVVVFSSVRANAHAQVGFLEDWRRLNVAITRPRRGLVLVGNAATLSAGDERWKTYLSWLRSGGFVVAAEQLFAASGSNGRR